MTISGEMTASPKTTCSPNTRRPMLLSHFIGDEISATYFLPEIMALVEAAVAVVVAAAAV